MKIVVDPNWTFTEALDAAWKAYSGGQQFGVPNRIRVLEQWANVVGHQRACSELEAALSSYKTIELASKSLGLSPYAIRKLRKSFKAMPTATPTGQKLDLYSLLKRLPKMSGPNEITFMTYALPKLAAVLGYDESEVYFEHSIPRTPFRADAVFTPSGQKQPYIIIEVKRSDLYTENGKAQLAAYFVASKAKIGLLLTPHILCVLHGGLFQDYRIEDITKAEAAKLQQYLSRPSGKAALKEDLSEGVSPRLLDLLTAVSEAKTNDDKKQSLERLAAEVFEIHTSIRCKYKNLLTASSEIDIVCEYRADGSNQFLAEYGRYFLVECKNWAQPAGAKEIRDFLGKLRKTRTKLGVLFSKSGITGEANGTDAVRELHAAYDSEGICVVVLTYSDLQSVSHLSAVINIVDTKLDALRFDLR